jgi:hypothetical protein
MRPIGLLLAFVVLLAGAYVMAQSVAAPSASPTVPALAAATATATPAATVTAMPTGAVLASPSSGLVPTPTNTALPTPTTFVLPSTSPGLAVPKAVIIVAPTGELTEGNLTLGEEMALRAEAAGMDVHRVFYPHATWEVVLAEIQGASLVAYYGHGYGWPSNTPELWEVQQDGMGLNAYDGSGEYEVHYYGANKIRDSIRLAPHAAVFLMRGCYTAGNGLNEDPIPPLDTARQHVDNYASGWLAVGAGAVFAFATGSRTSYPEQLMAGDAATVDDLFMNAGDAIGTNTLYFDSQRTPGARNHLDPHPTKGYLRALSGDLGMTAAIWRSGAGAIVTV